MSEGEGRSIPHTHKASLSLLHQHEGIAKPKGAWMKKEKKDRRGIKELGVRRDRMPCRMVKANMPDSKHMIISQLVY